MKTSTFCICAIVSIASVIATAADKEHFVVDTVPGEPLEVICGSKIKKLTRKQLEDRYEVLAAAVKYLNIQVKNHREKLEWTNDLLTSATNALATSKKQIKLEQRYLFLKLHDHKVQPSDLVSSFRDDYIKFLVEYEAAEKSLE